LSSRSFPEIDVPPRSASLHLEATLDHIALGSSDPGRLAEFYRGMMGLTLTQDSGGWWGEGPERRIRFEAGPEKSLRYAAYRLSDADQLEALKARLAAASWPFEPHVSQVMGEVIRLKDTDGNALMFGLASPGGAAVAAHGGGVLPARLQHIVMASRDAARLARFFQDVLGFVLSDNVVDDAGEIRTSFLRCSAEHHSFAVFQAAEDRLDHHCYEAGDWGLIRDWGDHLASQHIAVKWGPGRHGPGNNLFLFMHDIDGNWVELSAELEVVAPDRAAGVWPHAERTLNTWGSAPLRS
jgi:catechol 2,3-dioxygenase